MPAERDTAMLLERLAHRWADVPVVTVGAILSGLGSGGFALAILLFALPNCVPGPPLPGMSTVLGLPIALLSAQLALGARRPWLPVVLARRGLSGSTLAVVLTKAVPIFRTLGRVVRPRLVFLTGRLARRLAGALAVLLALTTNAFGRLVVAAATGPVRFWLPIAVATVVAGALGLAAFLMLPHFEWPQTRVLGS